MSSLTVRSCAPDILLEAALDKHNCGVLSKTGHTTVGREASPGNQAGRLLRHGGIPASHGETHHSQ